MTCLLFLFFVPCFLYPLQSSPLLSAFPHIISCYCSLVFCISLASTPALLLYCFCFPLAISSRSVLYMLMYASAMARFDHAHLQCGIIET